MKLEVALKTLGLPIGLIAVFGAVLAIFGISLDQVLVIAGGMIGLQLLIAVVVNVLKMAGVVDDGTAGKWSAVFNLLSMTGVAALIGVNPQFDFSALDGQFVDIARFTALMITYVVQISGTKMLHNFSVDGLGIKTFSLTGRK